MATSTTPRLIALGFAGIGITTVLAGCTTATADNGVDPGASVDVDTSTEYADGSYTADGDYISPAGPSQITVEITLDDDIVTAIEVTPHATEGNSVRFQGEFVDGISAVVVGEDIDTLSVSRVGGSSLTSGGFADALEKIKAEALAS